MTSPKKAPPHPNKPRTALDKYIVDFLEYCEIEKNRSQLTIRNYDHYLKRFAQFAATQNIIKPEDITFDTIRSYRLYLNRIIKDDGKSLKLATQQYHVIAIRAFLKYLIKRDIKTMAPEKIELGKTPSREVSVLTKEEIARLIAALDDEASEILRLRDKAILITLFSSGVRISELVNLKIDGVNLKMGEFTVRGKGDKLRLCFLSPDAINAIQNYLKARTDNHPSLFTNHTKVGQSVTKQIEAQSRPTADKNERNPNSVGLTARSVQRLIKKYCKIAGILHKVSPHTFRHSFATDLLQNGADIRSVQSLLGHASITTTQIYTHVTNQGLRDIHKRFHDKSEVA